MAVEVSTNKDLAVKIDNKDFNAAFIRSNFLQASWNFERMQNLGYAYQMIPIIKKLYPEGPERNAAIKRHLTFYNTHPFMTSPILGINIAMEEQRANGAPIDDAAINGLKVGMMGPLAGVGDPIFWGTVRPVLAALGASFALSGSILGPLIFFLGFNSIRLGFRWYTMKMGYEKGTRVVQDMSGGMMQKVTEGASIVGLFVMGALIQRWTSIQFPVVISEVQQISADGSVETVTTTLQDIFDQLLPNIAALGLTFFCMYLLRKNVSPIWLIFVLFGVGIIGYALGFLGN